MDIEVKLALQIVRPELAEMRFVPGDNGRKTDLPKTGEEGECSEDDGCEDGLPVVDDIYNALSLGDVRQSMCMVNLKELCLPAASSCHQ